MSPKGAIRHYHHAFASLVRFYELQEVTLGNGRAPHLLLCVVAEFL